MINILKKIIIFIFIMSSLLIFFLVKSYFNSHITLNDKYSLIDDKTGFSLIDKEFSKTLTSFDKSIVWYCSNNEFIYGCLGKSLLNKPESFKPNCLNNHFLLEIKDNKYNENIIKKELDFFINKLNIECTKKNLY